MRFSLLGDTAARDERRLASAYLPANDKSTPPIVVSQTRKVCAVGRSIPEEDSLRCRPSASPELGTGLGGPVSWTPDAKGMAERRGRVSGDPDDAVALGTALGARLRTGAGPEFGFDQ